MENKIEVDVKGTEWENRAETIKQKLGLLKQRGLMETMSRRYDFGTTLRRKYGEAAERCLLFHILASSTPILDMIERYDFDGEDSIEAFVDNWLKELP